MSQHDQTLSEALRREFPLLDEIGLDQELHHCEWSIQQERKRLHQLLDKLQTEQALAVEPEPLVRLTDIELIDIAVENFAEGIIPAGFPQVAHAIINAMIKKNGG